MAPEAAAGKAEEATAVVAMEVVKTAADTAAVGWEAVARVVAGMAAVVRAAEKVVAEKVADKAVALEVVTGATPGTAAPP